MDAVAVRRCAARGSRTRHPAYKVTRKTNRVRWYWRETLPQLMLSASVPVAFIVGLATGTLPALAILISAGYWGGMNSAGNWGGMNSAARAGFVARGWFGMSPTQAPSHPRPPAPQQTPARPRRLIARQSRRPGDPRRGRVTDDLRRRPLRLRGAGNRADYRHLEAVENPDRPEPDQDPPVPA